MNAAKAAIFGRRSTFWLKLSTPAMAVQYSLFHNFRAEHILGFILGTAGQIGRGGRRGTGGHRGTGGRRGIGGRRGTGERRDIETRMHL